MRFTLAQRLWLGFGVCMTITAALGLIAFMAQRETNQNFGELISQKVSFLILADEIQIKMLQHRRYEKDFMLNIGKLENQKKYLSRYKKKNQELSADLNNLKKLSQKDSALDQKTKAAVSSLEILFSEYRKGFSQVAKEIQADQTITPQKANNLMNPYKKAIHELEENINLIFEDGHKQLADSSAQTLAQSRTMIQIVLGLAGVCLLLSLFLGVWITLWTNRDLRRLAGQLGQGAEMVAQASNQVSEASQQLASGASQQAANVEETSASLEHMNGMSQKALNDTENISAKIAATKNVAANATSAMKYLRQSIEKMSKTSEKTALIVKSIDEIAFRTNLLALNAAVEAARAGEAGAGFAVVADEVRSLALNAAEAAKQTAELIQATIKQIEEGMKQVVDTDTAFDELSQNIEKIAILILEIGSGSKEQSQGIAQITSAARNMDNVTQQVATGAEETAASSEELAAQAEHMREAVLQLKALAQRDSKQQSSLEQGIKTPLLPGASMTAAQDETELSDSF